MVARAARRLAELELDDAVFSRARKVLTRFLGHGKPRTRGRVYEALDAAGISTAGQRGIHVLWRLAQEGLICFGGREGKQQTFVLLDAWAPDAKRLARADALAEIARRYFTAHGPATLRDFVWWTGLPVADAKTALQSIQSTLVRDGDYFLREPPRPRRDSSCVHLLPAFDEYLVGYRDRSAVLDDPRLVNAGGGLLAPTMVSGGRVVGTWKRTFTKREVDVALSPIKGSKLDLRTFTKATARLRAFLAGTSPSA